MSAVQGVLGFREVPWSCGYARYTDLMVKRAGVYTLQFRSIINSVSFLLETANFTVVRGSVHHLGMSLEPGGFRPNYAFKTQVRLHFEARNVFHIVQTDAP